jgi:cell division cycle 14
MSSPGAKMVDARGFRVYTPEDYLPIFRRYNVSCVIRLSEPEYDRTKFVKGRVNHIDLQFPDGACPEDECID